MPNQTQNPTLEDIIGYYEPRGLLAHPNLVRNFSEKIKGTPQEIPLEQIKRYISQLLVWPLIEIYHLWNKSSSQPLTMDEKAKIEELRTKYKSLSAGEDAKAVLAHLDVGQYYNIRFLNPFSVSKPELIIIVLSVMCEPLEDHIKKTHLSHAKVVHDAQMGGTIYVTGTSKDKAAQIAIQAQGPLYSFLQRSFICVDKNSNPVLFMDNVEGGIPYFKKLGHWRGLNEALKQQERPNKIHEVYLAMAVAMYMAKQLGIEVIIPRDFELIELSRLLGMREKSIFSYEQGHWKIGLHSKRKNKGVYTHSLYRGTAKNHQGHQLRHLYFSPFPFENPQDMLDEIKRFQQEIMEANFGRRSRLVQGTYEKLNILTSLNDIVQAYPLTPQYIKEDANTLAQSVLGTLSPLMGR